MTPLSRPPLPFTTKFNALRFVVVALALRYAGRQVPRQVLLDAWPGETRLLERLLGPAPT